VRGKTIELEEVTGFADGQPVSVKLAAALPMGGDLRRAFGAWADDAAELDIFLRRIHGERNQLRI
jgi:hypothetical protein